MMRPAKMLSVIAFSWILFAASAIAGEPNEGFEYQRISPPIPTKTGEKVEVLELFWYGCPHCYHLEPDLQKWLANKPAAAEFRRMPAVLNDVWAFHAKAFYTSEALGVLDQMTPAIFNAMHEKKQRLADPESIKAIFVANGVSADDFDRTFNSFFVDMQVRQARELSKKYGIDGVPAIAVNGKFRTSATLAGGTPQMFDVVNHLVAMEAAGGP